LHRDGISEYEACLQVGFYVLNDNPDAHFETKDDELCIPIMKGFHHIQWA
jgi:hypothetical protein